MKTPVLILAGLAAVLPAAAPGLVPAWEALADYRAADAVASFGRAEQSPDPRLAREARFGHGVALLARQPVDGAQIADARRIFRDLAASGQDDLAQGAEFYLARIAQHHAAQPDPVEAAQHFEKLIQTWPDSIWAQTALSRLALLEIYALDLDRPPAERIARATRLLAAARVPAAQSDLHEVFADAIFYFRLPAAQALPHLLAAERIGLLDTVTRPDVLVQIGELSRLQGEQEQARQYYGKFLREYPRDQRHYMVEERLRVLGEAGVAPAAGPGNVKP
ncbi:MAG: tol-pal system YbgF family protein [Opitutales bacterium]